MATSFVRKCCMAASVLILVCAAGARAQQQPLLSLQDLIRAAQANQPALLKKQAMVSSTHAAVTDARHTALPSLKLQDQVSLSSANSDPGTYFPTGLISTSGAIRADNNYQPATGNTAMLYSEYELENFGLNKARTQDAEAREQLAAADLDKDRYLVQLRTARTYFQLLKAYQQQAIEWDNVQRYDTLFTIISAQAAAGLRAGADSAQTKAELSKARVSYNTHSGEIVQLKQDLAYLTGIPAATMSIDTSLLQYADRMHGIGPEYYTSDTITNPLLDYYRKEKATWFSQDKVIRKSYLPKLLLVGGLWGRGSSIDNHDVYGSLGSGLAYNRFNYGIALALNYNLIDLIHRRDKLAVNHYREQQSDYALQEQQLQLQTAQDKAQAAMDVIDRNLQELPVQLGSANDLYRQKLAQYQAGVSNLVDLTNAAYLLRQVQTDKVQIITDWFLARLDKAAASGNLEPFIQSLK